MQIGSNDDRLKLLELTRVLKACQKRLFLCRMLQLC